MRYEDWENVGRAKCAFDRALVEDDPSTRITVIVGGLGATIVVDDWLTKQGLYSQIHRASEVDDCFMVVATRRTKDSRAIQLVAPKRSRIDANVTTQHQEMSAAPAAAPLTAKQTTQLTDLAAIEKTLMDALGKLRDDKEADPRRVATAITNVEQGFLWAAQAVRTGKYAA